MTIGGATRDDATLGHQGGWRRALGTAAALILLGLGVAFSIGIENGDGNHPQYLLHGIAAADASFAPGDWFIEKTTPFHLAFTWFVEVATRAGVLQEALALGSILSALLLACAIWGVIRSIYDSGFVAAALALALFSALGTHSVGLSNVLTSDFQPSVLSSALAFAGLALLLHRVFLGAGLALALAALIHAHIAILMLPTMLGFLGLIYVLPRVLRDHASAHGLEPLGLSPLARVAIPAIAGSLPALSQAALAAMSELGGDVSALYVLRFSHHYLPASWPPWDTVRLVALLSLGASALLLRKPEKRSDAGLLFALLGAITLVSLAIGWTGGPEFFVRLWPWRLAPFAVGIAVSLVAAALTAPGSWCSPATLRGTAGLAALLFGLVVLGRNVGEDASLLIYAMIALPLVITVVTVVRARSLALTRFLPAPLAPLLLVAAAAAPMVHEGIHRSHLALLPASADRRALYAWAASQSEEGDVFLVPPTWGEFRLVTRRAVVVDWKVVPFEAAEVAEWIARIDAITGGAGVPAGDDGIDEAYLSLTCGQLQDVATRYGALYVVLPGERDPCGPVAYQDAAWSVWSVRRVDERASRAEP